MAAAGATADWLYHLRGDTCALRAIKDGKISPPIAIPSDPDRRPKRYAAALEELRAVLKDMEENL